MSLTDFHEHGLDALSRFRTRLAEQEPLLLRELLAELTGSLALRGKVELVSDEHDDNVRVRLALELANPRLRLVEGGLASAFASGGYSLAYLWRLRDVVDDDRGVGVAEVDGGETLVAWRSDEQL